MSLGANPCRKSSKPNAFLSCSPARTKMTSGCEGLPFTARKSQGPSRPGGRETLNCWTAFENENTKDCADAAGKFYHSRQRHARVTQQQRPSVSSKLLTNVLDYSCTTIATALPAEPEPTPTTTPRKHIKELEDSVLILETKKLPSVCS